MTDYKKVLTQIQHIPVDELTGSELTSLGKMLFALGEQKLQDELREQLLQDKLLEISSVQ